MKKFAKAKTSALALKREGLRRNTTMASNANAGRAPITGGLHNAMEPAGSAMKRMYAPGGMTGG